MWIKCIKKNPLKNSSTMAIKIEKKGGRTWKLHYKEELKLIWKIFFLFLLLKPSEKRVWKEISYAKNESIKCFFHTKEREEN